MRERLFLAILALFPLALADYKDGDGDDDGDDRKAIEEDHAHDVQRVNTNSLSGHVLNAVVALAALFLLRQTLKGALYLLGSRLIVRYQEMRLTLLSNHNNKARLK